MDDATKTKNIKAPKRGTDNWCEICRDDRNPGIVAHRDCGKVYCSGCVKTAWYS